MTKMRDVVIGKNSKLWRAMADRTDIQPLGITALGHGDLDRQTTLNGARVWVFSYSRMPAENAAMFQRLKILQASEVVYISTATANVAALTKCYSYPTVKALAEQQVVSILGAKIVRIGVVHSDEATLPAGTTAVTPLDELCALMSDPKPLNATGPLNLFRLKNKPFTSTLEAAVFKIYGALIRICAPWPCLLRPLDVLCRAVGWNWYGYLYLSNRLWISNTSSSAPA
jgi:hypothetical protein